MIWTIPGTTIQAERNKANEVGHLFSPMFLTGGLTLGQVSSLSGLEPYAIQNWVKRGFLAPPKAKRYDIDQVCRILTINMLKSILPLERITYLLAYINGELDDTSDDIILDSTLYFMFVELASRARDVGNGSWEVEIDRVTASYDEPYDGARARVSAVLRVMVTAWIASSLKTQVDSMLAELQ